MIQPSRGWTDEDWVQSVRRLQVRGLMDRDGRLTKAGAMLRRFGVVPVPNLIGAPAVSFLPAHQR